MRRPHPGEARRLTIAVAACRLTPASPPGELFPDEDWPVLREALGDAVAVAWDDPSARWDEFDAVVLRTTWDGVDRPAAFLEWCRRVGPRLLNPLAIVEGNLDKRYLQRIPSAVPTQWVAPGDPVTFGRDFVVKPSISAGGRATARYGPDDHDAARAHVDLIHAAGRTAMVQDYVPGDEHKLVFIDGAYSHAFCVTPWLDIGPPQPRPWERPGPISLVSPAPATIEAAGRLIPPDAVYGRVNLVGDLVMEVELIEPVLALRLMPGSAESLATAIRRRLPG